MSAHQVDLAPASLVLYKSRPARVLALGEKIEIELEGGPSKRVRAKDIVPLHPGPVASLGGLAPEPPDPEEAWELLEGATTDLKELAELLFGAFTPAAAWGAWELLAEGLWFEGPVDAVRPRPREQIEHDRAARAAKVEAERAWNELLARLRAGRCAAEDRVPLAEVERLALGQGEHSRILKELGHDETPAAAHRLLVSVGYWAPEHNPYPARSGAPSQDPALAVPALDGAASAAHPPRLDLSHLPAFAIDDEGNQDPDDAVSFDGARVWVHVADVAALVPSESDLDREARARGANLYLPEGTVNMLPQALTEVLGLGLQAVSPALSFAMVVDAEGGIGDIEVVPTWVRVERLSYAAAEARLDEPPLAELAAAAARYRARREAGGAAGLELPEVSVRVENGEVAIRPITRNLAREMVTNLMLMAGEAAARYCDQHGVPIPYAVQPPPERIERPAGLAAMYAYRRLFRPSRSVVGAPERHFGLGLDAYTRATSPLRRYADLLVHQQLRAHLRDDPLLGTEQVSARAGEAEQGGIAVRRAERQSNLHWKLIHLARHPRWSGEGVVVELQERKAVVLIPELAMETRVRARPDLALDQHVPLTLAEVELEALDCRFRITG